MKQNLLAGLKPAALEDWYRQHYFTNEIDISGSGVEDYTYRDVFEIAGVDFTHLSNQQVSDAPTLGSYAIRKKVSQRFGDGDPGKVVVTSGANEGLQLIVRSLLNAGDKIITLGPCYHCHDQIAESMGVTVLKWEISINDRCGLDFDSLKSFLSQGVKAIFLNFPHNPTGRTISQSHLDDIVALSDKHNTIIVWDAVFQELTYESVKLKDPVLTYDRAISVGTFSKAYGAPGLRFGWIMSNCDIVEACARQKDYGNLYVPQIIELIASKMLDNLESFSEPRLKQASVNRKIVEDWLAGNSQGMGWTTPQGGVCGLVKVPDGIGDYKFCEQLLKRYGVLLVPGSCFGCPGYVRLGFGGNTRELEKGLMLINEFVVELLT